MSEFAITCCEIDSTHERGGVDDSLMTRGTSASRKVKRNIRRLAEKGISLVFAIGAALAAACVAACVGKSVRELLRLLLEQEELATASWSRFSIDDRPDRSLQCTLTVRLLN